MLPALDGAIAAMSAPMVSPGAVAFYLPSQEVARTHQVVQSGQVADEMFAGQYCGTGRCVTQPAPAPAEYEAAFFDRPHDEVTEEIMLVDDPVKRWTT